jgi:CheY-like chemotaxis protein
MATYLICEATPREAMSEAGLDRIQAMCRQALTRDGASGVRRIWTGPRTLRVLVVNGDRDAADDLAEQVYDWGHSARTAYDEDAALRVAAAQDPDVVLLEADLPVLDGCLLANRLRPAVEGKKRLVIAFADVDDAARRKKCEAAGIDLLLVKPVDLAVVETLLMLECELANRSRIGDEVDAAATVEGPLALSSIA